MLRILIRIIACYCLFSAFNAWADAVEVDEKEIDEQKDAMSRILSEAESVLEEGGAVQNIRAAAGSASSGQGATTDIDFSFAEGNRNIVLPNTQESVSEERYPSNREGIAAPPLVLVSFSMPDSELLEILSNAAEVGALVAVKGLVNDDWEETIDRIHGLIGEVGEDAGISIDPTLFRRFSVDTVPTHILPLDTIPPCTEDECNSVRHVRAVGAVRPGFFLETVARIGSDEAKAAASQWIE